MRHALAIALLLPVAGVIAQDKAPSDTPPSKKGDAIAISGCLRGSALEATDLGGSEDVSPGNPGHDFPADRRQGTPEGDEGEARQEGGRGPRRPQVRSAAGIMGGANGRQNANLHRRAADRFGDQPTDEAKRSVPVVEVKSYEGRDISCGR